MPQIIFWTLILIGAFRINPILGAIVGVWYYTKLTDGSAYR